MYDIFFSYPDYIFRKFKVLLLEIHSHIHTIGILKWRTQINFSCMMSGNSAQGVECTNAIELYYFSLKHGAPHGTSRGTTDTYYCDPNPGHGENFPKFIPGTKTSH